MKVGLVLEGGGMRGVFTAGVLDVFLEQDLNPDLCIGVSAGACLGCSYLCKQKGRGFSVMTDYLDNKDYCSFSSLVRTGDMFGANFLYHKIPEELYPIDNTAFLKNKTEFYAVVTNCATGKPEYPQISDMFRDVEYVRASSSLPLLARMVNICGVNYLDGGVADPIPVQKALDMGCDKVIVVLTQHRGFRKSPEKTIPLIQWKYRKYPNLVHDMKIRHQVYNDTLDQITDLQRQGKIFVIAPEQPLNIRRTEKDIQLLNDAYQKGKETASTLISSLKNYLSK